jgi:hypothetical protein
MLKKLKIVVSVLGVSLAIFSAWVFRPYAKPDTSLIDARLRSLQEPFQEVAVVIFLDGGTYGIRIVDQTGKQIDFSLPAPLGEKDDQYERLFVGALHYTSEGATEIDNAHHTKLRLAEILRSEPGVTIQRDAATAFLSGRWRDFWRVIRNRWIFHRYEN